MPCISVVVPIYQVEKYLHRCVESIRNQSVKDIEIILVDDGSPDDCPRICDELAAIDKRIRVLHKKNGGLSSARNAGVDLATGEYVFYLDSDDYIESTTFEELLAVQKSTEADIVLCNYYYSYPDHEMAANLDFNETAILSTYEAMEALVSGRIQNFAWGKLTRREIAQKHRFPEGKLFEDTYWAHLIFADADQIAILNKPLVHYVQREESISFTFTMKRLDVLDGWQVRKDFLEESYPDLVQKWMTHVSSAFVGVAWLVLTRMKKDKWKALRKLRRFSRENSLEDYADQSQKGIITALNKNNLCYIYTALKEKIIGR